MGYYINRSNKPNQMTTFITKAQREWLIAEFMEQLEEFDQLDEYPGMEEDLRAMGNVQLIEMCVDFMPLIMEMMPKKVN